MNFDDLSDYEKRIVRVLGEHDRALSLQEISAETGIAIDMVVTACLWLAQQGWVMMDRNPDPAQLVLHLNQARAAAV